MAGISNMVVLLKHFMNVLIMATFVIWLKLFKSKAKPFIGNQILHNHQNQILFEAFEFCKENNIVMVYLPSHMSNCLQPLDLTFYCFVKSALSRKYDFFWQIMHISVEQSLYKGANNGESNLWFQLLGLLKSK